jgi:hypothetical protein
MSSPTLAQQAQEAYERLWAAWIAGQLDAAHLEDLGTIAQLIDQFKKLETQQ